MASPKEDETQPGLRPEIEDFDRPLQIISIDETKDNKFSLNEENLNKIVAEIEKINPKKVVILSVVGAFRTGKSFLLDFLLRYLRYSEKNGDPPRMTDDQTMPEWVKAGGALTEGRSESKVPGFMWRSGSERETLGIWMYGKPFAKKLPGSSETVPVVLMDTQGMFDMKTSEEITAAIFGLSTLISSVQVYNISKQIQEDKLQQLHYFTEFSRVALKEFDKSQAREAKIQRETKGGEEKKLHPFQTLQFLVRDWEHFDDNDGVAKRVEEMDAVLEKAMSTQFNDRGTRQQIKDSFQQLKCFLFPHPGLKVPAKNYDGQLEVIEKSFFQLLDEYVHQLFGDMLVLKKINEREVGAQALAQFMKAYANVFKEGRLPVPLTLVEAISFTTNLCARDEAVTLYRATMDKETGSSGLPEDEFDKKHVEARTKALEWFDEKATFGSDEDINKVKSDLETRCENEAVKYKELNRFKIQRGIEQYVIPLLAAIVAYILDWATDWLCDSWSETCQKISRFTALFYYCVTLFFLYLFWQIYNKQGSASVGITAMHLGQATIQKAEEIRKQVKNSISPTKATEEKSASKSAPKSPTTKKND